MIIFLHILLMTLTFGQFSLYNITYNDMTLDTNIAELNNHTLREVFEGGNLVNINNYIAEGSATKGIVDNKLYVEQPNSGDYITQLSLVDVVNNGDKFYAKSIFTPIGNIDGSFQLTIAYGNTGELTNGIIIKDDVATNQNIELSLIATSLSTDTYFSQQHVGIYFRYTQPNNYYNVKSYFIYLNSYGISSLTVSEMDSYFDLYQDLKTNGSVHDYTYTENEVTLTDFTVILLSALVWYGVLRIFKEVF